MRLWSEGGEFLGTSVDQGKVRDHHGVHEVQRCGESDQHAPYALLPSNDDPIWTVYMSITCSVSNEYSWALNSGSPSSFDSCMNMHSLQSRLPNECQRIMDGKIHRREDED